MIEEPRLKTWLGALREAVAKGSFVRLQMNKPGPLAEDLKMIEVRPLLIKGEVKLSFTYRHQTRDIVKNYTLDEAAALIAANLADKFANARMFTLEGDLQLSRQGEGFALHRHPASETAVPKLDHNRQKNRIMAGGKGWMHALGLADAKGDILPTAQDKYRQINKYIEVLDSLLRQLPEGAGTDRRVRIADMGAGKGYLTFALYDHLANTMKRKAEVVGVEVRPDMVKLCNATAKASGFSGLSFVEGSIDGFDCAGFDVVIALHACDTATDDAIAKAVKAGAALIVVAPCCHKQIRREMEKARQGKSVNPLEFLLKYGTYVERVAEMVTDGLRAELLELSGYKVNLFEFISDTHTPKNVMITAVRQGVSEKRTAALRGSIQATKAQFGIGLHYLEGALGV
ncbi:MAG: SAM-dependent methyltransferase [Rhizobiaceae bacterium]